MVIKCNIITKYIFSSKIFLIDTKKLYDIFDILYTTHWIIRKLSKCVYYCLSFTFDNPIYTSKIQKYTNFYSLGRIHWALMCAWAAYFISEVCCYFVGYVFASKIMWKWFSPTARSHKLVKHTKLVFDTNWKLLFEKFV